MEVIRLLATRSQEDIIEMESSEDKEAKLKKTVLS